MDASCRTTFAGTGGERSTGWRGGQVLLGATFVKLGFDDAVHPGRRVDKAESLLERPAPARYDGGHPGACSSVTRAMASPARSSTRSTGWTDCCEPRTLPAGALSGA